MIECPRIRQKRRGLLAFWLPSLSLWLVVYVPWGHAEESEYPIYELGEIVVTAPRLRPASSTVVEISAEEMEQQGVHTVSEALEMVPGITVSVGSKNEVAVQVRGANPRRVLVLVDGRPVNMPYYGTVDLNTIPVDAISKIKVTKGPSSLLYGVNGPGGIVNIVTRRSREQEDHRLSASIGKHSTYRFQATAGGRLGQWDYHATSSRHKTDGYSLSKRHGAALYEDGGLRDNSDFDRVNLTGKLGYHFGPKGDCALALGYYKDVKGIPPFTQALPEYRRFVDWKRYYVDGTARMALNPRCSLKGKLFYDAFVNELIEYENAQYDPAQINWDSIHDNWDRGGMLQLQGQWGLNSLTVGGNAKQEVINRKPDVDEPWETFEMITASAAIEGVFAIPQSPLTITAGSGYSAMRCDDQDDGHLNSWSVDGTLGVNAFLGARYGMYAAVGRHTRYPTMHQLYSRSSGSVTVGHVMLEPEQVLKVELGGEHQMRRDLSLRFALFRDDYRNLIDGSRTRTFQNVTRAYSRGAECGMTLQWPERNVGVDLDYTFTETREQHFDKPWPFIPKHKVDLRMKGRFRWGGAVYLGAQWVGSRPQEEKGLPWLDGYFVAKSRLSYRWRWLETAVVADNLLDENYSTEEEGFPMPGRTIRFEVALGTKG